MEDSEFVSLPEAAKTLGISRATAYTWALAGRIPAQLIAGRYAVRRRDLSRLQATLTPRPRRGITDPPR